MNFIIHAPAFVNRQIYDEVYIIPMVELVPIPADSMWQAEH